MRWRIGDWIACSDTDTLKLNGESRKIERRAMEALLVLASRCGQVVKKDELIVAVWGRLAVSDHSVAMVVSQLRRAFNDDARAPRYIETITKRGYRLIASCEPLPEAAIAPVHVAPPVLPPRRLAAAMTVFDTRRFSLISGAAVLAGISAGSLLLLWPG